MALFYHEGMNWIEVEKCAVKTCIFRVSLFHEFCDIGNIMKIASWNIQNPVLF